MAADAPAKVIAVEQTSEDRDRFTLRVRVSEGGSETVHETTLARHDFERLGRQGETVNAFVTRCFEFLLAREPKESILRKFDVSVIGQYFSDFERDIAR